MHIDTAQEYSKARKIDKLETLDLSKELKNECIDLILDGETFDDVMARRDADDRLHWITHIGKAAGADLLTIGKVQPENMIAMAALPPEDFQEAVKTATSSARSWNQLTISAEKDLNTEELPSTML
tara:strand:+ start:3765 stop:4142 length:378 start_codon:yes stop_codon:yes gene_type:complete